MVLSHYGLLMHAGRGNTNKGYYMCFMLRSIKSSGSLKAPGTHLGSCVN